MLDDCITDRTYNGTGLTVRQKEALEAQKILGMKNAGFLGFCDRTECSAREISKKIVEVIREIRPDAVFSVDPNMLYVIKGLIILVACSIDMRKYLARK